MKKPFSQTRVGNWIRILFSGPARKVEALHAEIKDMTTEQRAVVAVQLLKKLVNDPRTAAWTLETRWKVDDVALALFKEWLATIVKVLGLVPEKKEDWEKAAIEAANALRGMYPTPRGEKLAEMAARFELAQVSPEYVGVSIHSSSIMAATERTQEAYEEMKASGELSA